MEIILKRYLNRIQCANIGEGVGLKRFSFGMMLGEVLRVINAP